MAESATPFTRMVTIDRANSIPTSVLPLADAEVPAMEKKMRAITPTNNPLKIKRNSRSLYGFLPEYIIAPTYTISITNTRGLNIFAITGDTFPTNCGLV